VKKIRNKLASLMTVRLPRTARWVKLVAVLAGGLAAGLAGAQPANDNFASAWPIVVTTDSTNGDNLSATLELPCETNAVNTTLPDGTIETPSDPIGASVWFTWTAPVTGTVAFDTFGSDFDTVLAVWTSPNLAPTMCDGSLTNIVANDDDPTNAPQSSVSFSAVAGTTYYIEVSGYDSGGGGDTGNYLLNWSFSSIPTVTSGSFKFTSANYIVSERDSSAPNAADGNTVNQSVRGARLTVTRPSPGYGRVYVDYTVTVPPITNINTVVTTINNIRTNNIYYVFNGSGYTTYTVNGVPDTNGAPFTPAIAISTNVIIAASGLTAVTNTIAFDNLQLHQDILLPVTQGVGNILGFQQLPSMSSLVTLSNPRLDSQEPSTLAPPTLSLTNSSVGVTVLSTAFPKNGTNAPSILNLERSTFRVNKDVAGGNAVISVIRTGGNGDQAVSVSYTIDPTPGGGLTQYSPANSFPLQAGSDYATPDSDYTPQSGTLNWAAYDATEKTITIPILNNGQVEFNMDFLVKLYFIAGSTHTYEVVGQVNQANVTILFDQTDGGQQPAGALDRTWNKDLVYNSDPVQMTNPGTAGKGGIVYAVAAQPDGKAIIAGSFKTYDGNAYNCIVRVLANGYRDTTFLVAPNSGASELNSFIAALALQSDKKIIIGGNFTSFNGSNRHYIARLNSDGSVDSTFNPGLGADGKVWSVALAPSGQIIIGGEFANYNGTSVNHVARLNTDGSLDTTFNPGVGPDGAVNAVALDASGRVIIGGAFENVDGVSSGAVARLNSDGTLDTTFTPGIGTFNPDGGGTDAINALAVQSDGKILIGGGFSYFDLVSYYGLARLNTDGTVDLSFSPGTGTLNPITGDADAIYSILLQTNGEILVGGDLTTFNQTRRVGLARLFTDGSVDTSFMDSAYNEFAGVPNRYFNPDAVATNFPTSNTRNAIYALAQEAGGNVIIGGSFTRVGGGYTREDIHPRSNVARLVGGVTPGPGNLQLVPDTTDAYGNKYYEMNNGSTHYITLTRTNGNLGIISATFSTNTAAAGPGVASGADFSLDPTYSEPTWTTAWTSAWTYETGVYGENNGTTPVNVRTADVYVTATNSGNITGDLSADFELVNPVGNFSLGGEYIELDAALGPQASVPLIIHDVNSQPGVIGFSSPTYSVIEDGSLASITLTRTNGTDGDVQIGYATSNGTATNGSKFDYTGTTNYTFTIKSGCAVTNFTIQTSHSYTSVQPDKTVNLRLFGATGGATIGLSNAVLTLINNNGNYSHLSFSQSNFSTNENSGTLYVTIQRRGSSSGTLGVTVKTGDGTAVNGVNYIGYSNTLTWTNNGAAPKTIAIPVLHDYVVTPDLIANIYLTNSTVNGTNNTQPLSVGGTNATLTIVNVDSAGAAQFSSAVYSVKKYGGYALIPVVRIGGNAGSITNTYTTIDGTALAGTDYVLTTGTLIFTNGQVSQYFSVPIINNTDTNQLPRKLTLQLAGANLGSPSLATLNIINTEDVTGETPGSADTTYSAFAGFNNSVNALVLQPNNQLLAGGDFTMADGVVRNRIARLNADGSLDAGFSLPSSSKGADGSVRALALQADGRILVGGSFTNFNSVPMQSIARLNHDGSLDSQFQPGSGANNPVYTVAQTFVGGVAKVLIGGAFTSVNGTTFNGIARLNSDGSSDTTFNPGGLGANGATVYALAVQTDGKIVIGGDFTKVNNILLNHIARLNVDGSVDTTFTPGTGASGSVRAITLQLDGKILIGGGFTNVNGVALNHIARLNVDGTVDSSFVPGVGANDTVLALSLQSDNRIVVGGSFTTCSGVTRSRITRLNPDGGVDSTINFGTGANDFIAAIAIQEDTITGYPTNVPDEKILIGGGFTQYNSQAHAHLARIYGGSMTGSGAFQFSSASYQVDERGTNVVITVLRTGGTTNAPSGDVFVTATATDGSAVNGINYSNLSPFTLDFPLGEVLKTFTIPVKDDGVVTTNLTVNLTLSNPTTPAGIGNQPNAVLTIINDDAAMSFSSPTYTVAKNVVSGVAPISIVRNGGTSGTATAYFSTTLGGTATTGTDYTPVSTPVAFAAGVSNVVVNIPINNNGLPEGNQTVTMQLTNVSGATPLVPTNATLTIIDTVNAPGQLSFATNSYSVTEGGGFGYSTATVTVQRTYGSSGAVSVSYNTQDGTASAGVKYMPTNGVLTFADGEASKSFNVQVVNTTTAEGPEYFNVVLTNATGGASLTTPTNATVMILNTNTGLAFVQATNTFTEPSGIIPGSVVLNVIRFNNTNGTTTVNYSTADGTAVTGTNYVGITNGLLTFNPGEAIKPITITTRHDARVTGNLFFTVGLANPSVGAQLTSPSVTTVIDQDADAGISFLLSAQNVYRNAGSAVIQVICSNTNVGPVSVNYSTSGGTAVAGTDYTATSGTLTFTNGQFLNYFFVPLIVNNQVQSNKTFNVTLSSPTAPGQLVSPSVETVTIVGTNTPYGLSYTTPVTVDSSWGSTNIDNSSGGAEIGDPIIAGYTPTAPVWVKWTAPADGEVALDTIGSTGTNGLKLDTVLAVFTGNSLSTLSQVAANDDLYPLYPSTQFNETVQNIYNTNAVVVTNGYTFNGNGIVPNVVTNNFGLYQPVFTSYYQPYAGPSGLRFNAKAGTTYYFAADTKASYSYTFIPYPPYYLLTLSGTGPIHLNWAYHSSGVFRFASENVDQTGIKDTNGNPILLYQCAETEGANSFRGGLQHGVKGPVNANEYRTTTDNYYSSDVNGLLVTVTRVAGSSGRVLVDYTTVDGSTNLLKNGDVAAVAGIDYTPVSGTLIFNDFEMSKTIVVPITDDGGVPQPNRDFTVVLSNPRRDPAEATMVSAPRVDSVFGQVLCRILDCDIDPSGPSISQVVRSNTVVISGTTNTIFTTNVVTTLIATNGVFNFSKSNYRVPRDIANYWNGNTPVTVYVNRMGTNTASVTLTYRFDNYFLDKNGADFRDIYFPLQPGSDYAVPTPASSAGVLGTNSDFNGGTGTITFPGGTGNTAFQSQPIHFTVNNNHLTEFNKDIHIGLYELDSKGNPQQDGMVAETTVTILFDDLAPPAGSVDELYNPDFGVDLLAWTNTFSFGSAVINPGTDPLSEVYTLALTTNNQTVIGGSFATYSDGNNTYTVNGIARLNFDGSLDTTFNSGVGINVHATPVGEFIRSLALTPANQVVIGGNFTSYNGTQRNGIARLNANGSLDSSFTPGAGANGTVWSVLVQADGKVVIGGDFTTYNSVARKYIARLNTDGSLDTTFNSSNLLSGPVYALAENGSVIVVGGKFNVTGQRYANLARLNLDGSLDTTFNPGSGTDASVMSLGWQANGQIVVGGTFQTINGNTCGHLTRLNYDGSLDTGFFAGTGADGTVYSITLPADGTIYIGGNFTTYNGTHRLGLARLYADGTLDTSFLDTAYNQFAGLSRLMFGDAPGTVYASALQADGNVMIGGSFQQVGGGQADMLVRNDLELERGLLPSFADPNLWVSEGGTAIEPKSRDGVRNRSNVARLIGGVTPGPGNVGMVASSYAVNKTQLSEPITLVRTNGFLGYASANFAVVPGLAQSGVDYSYNSVAPLYPIDWEYSGPTRMHSDGLFGANGIMQDSYGDLWKYGIAGPASVNITIINNSQSAGNLTAGLQMANPAGADQFYLGGQNIPLGVALGESFAPLTVVDNGHQDGVFSFTSASYTATNSSATVGVVRTNSTIGTVTVYYQTITNGSTAILGTDYVATNGSVVFSPGQSSNSFAVSILQNSYISSTEKSVNLQLYNIQDSSGGYAFLGMSNAVLRIINPNYQGYLNLSTNYYTANLSAKSISFVVNRVVGSKGTLTVQYATTNGTAVNGVDYIGATNTLTWVSGDVSPRIVTIPLVTNSLVGTSDKQFGVNLFNPTWNGTNSPLVLGAVTSAVLNIVDDNSNGTFQFAASSYLVNENGGSATITVTRTGSGLGAAAVNYTTANGSAMAGTNYVATNGVLNFAQGQVTRSFNVSILNDGKTNPPPSGFYFTAALTGASAGAVLGSPTNVPVRILDAQSYNQPPGVLDTAFDSNTGMNNNVLALALQSDGQIVAGGNFTLVNSSSRNRVARLNLDGSLDTSFLNGLAGADGAVNALVSQTDDRVVIGGAFATIDGTLRNHIARLMTDGSVDTTFNPGAGADNSVFALAETFINGSREIYVGGAFSTFNGNSYPGLVRLYNSGTVDTAFAPGSGANGTVYAVAAYPTNSIYNAGQVLVGGAFTNFNSSIVGNLVRLNSDGSVDTNFAVNVGANAAVRAITIQPDGSVLIGGDFTNVNNVAVNHIARLNPDGSLDLTFITKLAGGINGTVAAIALQSDNRIVVGGQFTQANGVTRNNLTRLLPTGAVDPTINFGAGANGAVNAVVVQPADAMLVIGGAFTQYNGQSREYLARIYGGSVIGSGAFEFTTASYQIAENAGFAIITVTRTGGTSGTNTDGTGVVNVNFTTTNGTAVAGVNYSTVNTTIAFPAGEVFETVFVPVADDLVVTPDLTVKLALSNPTVPAGLGDQATAVLTIINVDSGVSFSSGNYSVAKNAVNGVATIDIIRQGSTSGSCTVNFATTTNGTATAGVDYYPTNALITFNAGETDKTIQIPIINNVLPEGNRTVGLQLTNVVGALMNSPSNAALTIIDTVYAPGVLSFSATNYIVNEDQTNALLTVLRTNGSSGSVSVDYVTVPGSAAPGSNYLTASGTLTLADGQTSGTILVPLINNPQVFVPTSLSVLLSNPSGGAALSVPTNAMVTILSVHAGVAFQSATNYVSETNAIGLVFVQRFGLSNSVAQVNYATTNNGTAVAGVNYGSVSGTLTFGLGQMIKAISVPLYNNNNTTNLSFGLNLFGAAAGTTLVPPSSAVVFIQGGAAGLSFITNAVSVMKNSNNVVITVICSNPGIEPVVLNTNTIPLSVNYSTTNGTAVAGTDYTPVSGTLVFTNGNGTNTFIVPILNNGILEGNRTFNVMLSQPTAPGVLLAPTNETVTIIDINTGLKFSRPTYSVLKTGLAATINVLRTGYTNSVVAVNYQTTNGTAIAGQQYLSASGTLVFTNGVTSQTFTVPILDNTTIQQDLTVLLQLLNPTNASLIYPSFSTLTIHDTSGSLVVPAGAVLVNEGFSPPNGIIDPAETNTVMFGLRASAGVDVTNLVATLLATNGVTFTNGAASVSSTYGYLTVGGHAVFRPFTFIANGTNAQNIVPTFNLMNGSSNLGPAIFTFTLGSWKTVVSNTAPITINAVGAANPYPSFINVGGLAGVVVKTTVTLTNMSHYYPGQMSALVVAPNQSDTLIMSHAGQGNNLSHVTLTFDDAATNSLPHTGQIYTGTNKPTQYPSSPVFP